MNLRVILILKLILILILILTGLEILDIEKQIDTIKDAFESSITNNACRKRRAVKHFKHMLFLAEVLLHYYH